MNGLLVLFFNTIYSMPDTLCLSTYVHMICRWQNLNRAIRTVVFLLFSHFEQIWRLIQIQIHCRILMHRDENLFSEIYTFDNVIAFDTQIKVNSPFSSHLSSFRITYFIGFVSMRNCKPCIAMQQNQNRTAHYIFMNRKIKRTKWKWIET